jgi:hypothetical protein
MCPTSQFRAGSGNRIGIAEVDFTDVNRAR